MRVLALDTSTWWGSAAVAEGEPGGDVRVVAERRELVSDSHAARLLPMVERLLEDAGWRRDSVDLWAAVRGPGSFTGLRVCLGTLRGLALSSGKPALGVGTLEAMAETYGPADGPRIPVLDAGRGQVYAAVFDSGGSPPGEIVPPWVGPPGGLPEGVRIGSGTNAGRNDLPNGFAAGAARIAWKRFLTGAPSGEGVAPLYLRPADAERTG